jgi:hypothetical protein
MFIRYLEGAAERPGKAIGADQPPEAWFSPRNEIASQGMIKAGKIGPEPAKLSR